MPPASRFLFARPLSVGLLLLALLPFVGLIFFAQPAIDDFDNANTVARLGRWGAQWHWYTTWSGRFVAIGFSTVFNPLSHGSGAGVTSARLWALRGMLLLLLLGLTLALQQLFRALLLALSASTESGGVGAAPPRFTWGLTLAVLALGLNALPEPFTLLYWYSSAVNYGLPLALSLGFAAAALHTRRGAPGRRWYVVALGCLMGAVGGGELTLLSCLLLLAGLGAGAGVAGERGPAGAPRRQWAGWLAAGLVTATLMLGAPGNWHRAALTNASPWTRRVLLLAPRTALAAARLVARPPVLGAALLLAGAVLLTAPAGRRVRPGRRELAVVLGGYALLNVSGIAFMKLVFADPVPGRVANVLVLQLLISTTALALWARPWLPPLALRRARAAPAELGGLGGPGLALLVVLLIVVLLSGQTRRAGQELLLVAPAYAEQMQARYSLLEAARRRGAAAAVLPPLRLPAATGVLAPLPSAGQPAGVSLELSADHTRPNNQDLALYYGLRRVRLASPPPPPPAVPR